MYYLKDEKRQFILFWSPRVACMSLKHWFHELTETEMPLDNHEERAAYKNMHIPDFKKIIVVRNPIDRFVSILNHMIIYTYLLGKQPPHIRDSWNEVKFKGKERISLLLDFIEKNGTLSDHHFELQCFSHDNPEAHIHTNVSRLMTHVVKLEDGPLIQRINKMVDVDTKDYQINICDHFYKMFEKTGVTRLYKKDLSDEDIKRIKDIYHYDFLYFYPELI